MSLATETMASHCSTVNCDQSYRSALAGRVVVMNVRRVPLDLASIRLQVPMFALVSTH